jgi:uncharacterized circularly permuted ATP-grasp superfamily protein
MRIQNFQTCFVMNVSTWRRRHDRNAEEVLSQLSDLLPKTEESINRYHIRYATLILRSQQPSLNVFLHSIHITK